MNNLLPYLAQASVCLLAFFAFYHLALRKETCFQYNRAYLLLAPPLSFLLPLVPLPGWLSAYLYSPLSGPGEMVMVEAHLSGQAMLVSPDLPAAEPFSWTPVIWTLYGMGFCFFAYRFLRQLFIIRGHIRNYQAEIVHQDGIRMINTRGQLPTFSFLNYLFWNSSQTSTESEKQKIIQHEAVHISQKHTWDLLYLESLTLVFWFNPLLHLYKKALISTHEFIADATVIRTTDQQEYATLLVKQVFEQMDLTIGHFFNRSLTLKRMKMLHRIHHRPNRLKQVLALPLLAGLLFLVSPQNTSAAEGMEETAPGGQSLTAQDQNAGARFPGGKAALEKYLKKNIQYPAYALKNEITGQALIQVTIDGQGRVGNIKTLQADNPYFEEEATRVLRAMPDWQPANNGKAGPTTLAFPFIFGLESKKGLPAIKLPATTTPASLQPTTIVVGYSQVIAGQTVVQKSTEPGAASKKATPFPRDNKVFSFVEQPPIFPGGDKAMNEFIRENLNYPSEAKKNGKEGLVVIQFVVDRNGKVYDAAVVKSLGDGTDEEALRVVELFPDFEPAKQNGKPVEFRFTLPIRFGLAPKDPANGYVPPSKANPDGSYLSTSGKEPAAPSDCNPKLQLTLHGDNIKKISYFEMAYEKPEGCSGDKYLVESIHYFILRDKVKLMEKTISGNTLNLADVRAASQPGDVLNILVKGNSVPENKTNAPVPFQTGTVIPWK